MWNIKNIEDVAFTLAKKHKFSPFFVQVLLNRNIGEADWDYFLNSSQQFHDPKLLPDIEKAANRIKQAVKNKEKIFIYGDYDVDGITSLVIFNQFIQDYPGQFCFYIPHRVDEGYGLNREVIAQAKEDGYSLIVAFDCGTNSVKEVALVRSLGMEIVIIDHHHVEKDLTQATAFVNPKRKDSQYPFKDLSAAALSFKLLQVLLNQNCHQVLDLVALSTVCDVVPLKDENRALLKAGLKELKITNRPAIKALCKIGSIRQPNIEGFHIGFVLGPRINAAGRVAHAKEALELFLCADDSKAGDIALRLQAYNILRKDIEVKTLRQAEEILASKQQDDYAIVVAGENWHQGVLGIVASRLTDKYYRPAFVISWENNLGRGSGRSIPSVHLMENLAACSKFLLEYGGHKRAAGIHVAKDCIDNFRVEINKAIKHRIKPQDLVPILNIDACLKFTDITIELCDDLERMKPFGEENAQALFVSFNVAKRSAPKKSVNGHNLWLESDNRTWEAVVYDKDFLEIFAYAEKLDIVYALDKNTFHNAPKLVIKDVRLAGDES
jgi:single-stranded-DNA-specific exonuclease